MSDTEHTTREQIEAMRKIIAEAKVTQRKGGNIPSCAYKSKLIIKMTSWIIFFAVVTVLIATLMSINTVKNEGKIPELFGYQLYLIESGSMDPTLPVGSIILSRIPKNKAALNEGDIVTFRNLDNLVVTHRITEVLEDHKGTVGYKTKGDNPISSPDHDILTPERVIAVFILKIPYT